MALAATLLASAGHSLRAAGPGVDAAFSRFWRAASPAEAVAAGDAIVASGVSFDEALTRLKNGRPYLADVPKGVVRLTHRLSAIDYPYMLDVPESYDPARKYPVRIQLHGGVGRPEATSRGNGIGALAGVEQIYVLPTAWASVEWWTDRQLANLRSILDSVKRTYNVDENRVVLSGVSDGATGAYYVAMRETTPFASFLPLNGALVVLRNPRVGADGEMFPQNFVNKPFFIVNGGKDPLYPTSIVEPYIRQMEEHGVSLTYLPQPEAGHNTAWWPDVKNTYEAFVRDHPRQPVPDSLTWETDQTAGTNRAHWLVIDELAPLRPERLALPDVNVFFGPPIANFGVRASGARITSVLSGTSADRFGILPGDVIVRANDRTVPFGVDVVEVLSFFDPRTPLSVIVSRDNKPVELKGVFEPVDMPRTAPMFSHAVRSGRVDLVRAGNTVTATTRGVARFTLLLSSDVFDFAAPVRVVADGKVVFQGTVTPSLATLLKWAARDNDRTLLFGAEVTVTLAP